VDSDSNLGGPITLTDSTSSTSTTTAATPNSVKTTYDIATAGWEAFNFGATGIIATVPRFVLTTASAPTSGTIYFTRLIPHRAFVVSNISYVSAASVATPTLIRFGIYTRSGSTYTLVARTDSDTTIFASSNTKYTRALSTTGGYPATYSMNLGAEYWLAVIQVAVQPATILTATAVHGSANVAATGSQSVTLSGRTDLVTATANTASQNTNGGYYAEVS